MTQHDYIKAYIDDFGSITPMEAFADLGITKLSTRICEMDREQKIYKREMIQGKNRYGKPIRYMKYSLLEEQ